MVIVSNSDLGPRVPFISIKNRHRPGKVFGRIINDNAATGQAVENKFIYRGHKVRWIALAVVFEIDGAIQVKFLTGVNPTEVAQGPHVVVPFIHQPLSFSPRLPQENINRRRGHGD